MIHVGWQAQSKIEQSYSEKPSHYKIFQIFHFKTFALGIGIKSPVMI